MDEEAVRVTGGCLCGSVRYEAEAYLRSAHYCHCRTCQKLTGAPVEVDVLVKDGSLKFTSKQPKYYQTSHFAERGFCPDCGSRLTYRLLAGGYTNVTMGSLDDSTKVIPIQHLCVESQLPWFRMEDGSHSAANGGNPGAGGLRGRYESQTVSGAELRRQIGG